jgi:vacuolar protein-sorting-associated protein 4
LNEYLIRAEEISDYIHKKQPESPALEEINEKYRNKSNDNEEESSQGLKKSLESAIIKENPNVKWSDIAGLHGAKQILQEAVILPARFPELFTGKVKPWKGILLYGPPGTGKSFLAKACATEASSTFFSVSSSDLVSKFMGESERLVRSLFEMARNSLPAIIFIDEIDSLFSSRTEGENNATRRIKTEFLVQMQGVGHQEDGLLVLGATNTPWELDSAARRRFERRVYIPLPDEFSRKKLFELNIGDTPNDLYDQDLDQLAEITEGYSGSDISTIVKAALMEPIRKCQTACYFKKIDHAENLKFTPCAPSDLDSIEMTLMDVPKGALRPPNVSLDDFFKILDTTKPSVSPQDLIKHQEFTEEFGLEG